MALQKVGLKFSFSDPHLNVVLRDLKRGVNNVVDYFLDTDLGNLRLYDTDRSDLLDIKWNEDASNPYTLNLKVNSANRTIDLSGNLTVESASIINQDLTTDASWISAGLSSTGEIDITKSSAPLLDLHPGFTGSGVVIEIAPSAPLASVDAEWDGININGNALDPGAGATGALIHGIHVDFSGIDMTYDPHVDGIHVQAPSCLCGSHAFHAEGEVHVNMDTTAAVASQSYTALDIVIDTVGATGGLFHALDVARVTGGTLSTVAVGTHTGIDVIHQLIGTATAFGAVLKYDGSTYSNVTAACIADDNDVTLWDAQDDEVYFGHSTTFDEIECIWETPATKDMHFTFWYSTGTSNYTEFDPADDTRGGQTNGLIRFLASDISWATGTVDSITKYWIKVIRTRLAGDPPTEDTVKFIKGTTYQWDKDGLINCAGSTVYKAGQDNVVVVNADADQIAQVVLQTAGSNEWALYRPANSVDLRVHESGVGDVMSFLAGGKIALGTGQEVSFWQEDAGSVAGWGDLYYQAEAGVTRRFFKEYDVRDYGAKGDGSTDDQAAIQALFDDVAEDCVIVFPRTDSYYRIDNNVAGKTIHIDKADHGRVKQVIIEGEIRATYPIVVDAVKSGVYKWTASGSGDNEYYCEASAGGDPGLTEPATGDGDFLSAFKPSATDQELMTEGAMGSLGVHGWDWGDNDSLNYSTIYVRLEDEADPDDKADGYVKAVYKGAGNLIEITGHDVHLIGQGGVVRGSGYYNTVGDSNFSLIYAVGQRDIKVEGLIIYEPGTIGIRLNSCTGASVSGNTIMGGIKHAAYNFGTQHYGISIEGCTYTHINDNTFLKTDSGTRACMQAISGGGGNQYCTIHGNIFEYAYDHMIYGTFHDTTIVGNTGDCDSTSFKLSGARNTITGNTINGAGGGISAYDGAGTIIVGNKIAAYTHNAIEVQNSSGSDYSDGYSDIIVSNNVLTGDTNAGNVQAGIDFDVVSGNGATANVQIKNNTITNGAYDSQNYYPIQVIGSQPKINFDISGNIINTCDSHGIVISSLDYSKIHGNTVIDAGRGREGHGIHVESDSSFLDIKDNLLVDIAGENYTHGIFLTNTASVTNCIIGVNTIRGTDTAEISAPTTRGHKFFMTDTSGYVGINRPIPNSGAFLEVGGDIAAGYSDTGKIALHNAAGTEMAFLQLNDGILLIDADSNIEIKPNNTPSVVFFSSGNVRIGSGTENAKMTRGLTINQGEADDEILAFKSSDVAHGITTYYETDTYGFIKKVGADDGGVALAGLTEATIGVRLKATHTTDNTTKDNTAQASVMVSASKKVGTGDGNVGANANIFAIQSFTGDSWKTGFIVAEDGNILFDGTHGAYQDHDDIELLAELEVHLDKSNKLKSNNKYKKKDLEDAKLLRPFLSTKGLNMLQMGAMRQMNKKIETLTEEVRLLKNK